MGFNISERSLGSFQFLLQNIDLLLCVQRIILTQLNDLVIYEIRFNLLFICLSLNIGNDIFSGHEHINCLILNIILLQIDLLKSLSLLLNFAFNLQFNYSVLLFIFWWVWAASYCHFSNCMILQLLYVLLPLWNIEWIGVEYALLTHKLIL